MVLEYRRPFPDRRTRMDKAFLDTWTPRALGLMRIDVAYLFLTHGTAKLLGIPHQAMFYHLQLLSMAGVAGILDLVGGALRLVGLFQRPTAVMLSREIAVGHQMRNAA